MRQHIQGLVVAVVFGVMSVAQAEVKPNDMVLDQVVAPLIKTPIARKPVLKRKAKPAKVSYVPVRRSTRGHAFQKKERDIEVLTMGPKKKARVVKRNRRFANLAALDRIGLPAAPKAVQSDCGEALDALIGAPPVKAKKPAVPTSGQGKEPPPSPK